MENYLRAIGLTALGIILLHLVSAREKSFGTVLSMTVCALLLSFGIHYLQPVLRFIRELETIGDFQPELVNLLLKTVGIGLLTEIAALLCVDSGNSSLAQSLRLCGTGVSLWLALPMFESLLELIQRILEGV